MFPEENFMKLMTEGVKEWTGAAYVFESDPIKAAELIMAMKNWGTE